MKTLYTALANVTALALGTAGAFSADNNGDTAAFMTGNECFFAKAITDWRPLDCRTMAVFAGARNPYRVQRSMPSSNPRFEGTIAFTDRDGRICPYGGDAVVVGGAIPDRHSIAAIRRLSDGQLEALYFSCGIERPVVSDSPETPAARE